MSKTLLQLTQLILSDMDSDEVNSIYDTVEALQVATIVANTIESEFSNINLPSFDRIMKLTSVSDVNRPNYLTYGDDSTQITWLRYRDFRNHSRYNDIQFLTPEVFFDRQLLYTNSGPHTALIADQSGVAYYIKNNSCPHFYTSVDNKTLIFDSYDADFEDTLEESNTFCIGSVNVADVPLADDYIPPIPNNLFPLLLAEAKATAFLTLKQMASPKNEQIARRQRSRMQKVLYKTAADTPYARSKFNFGRYR